MKTNCIWVIEVFRKDAGRWDPIDFQRNRKGARNELSRHRAASNSCHKFRIKLYTGLGMQARNG